MDSDSYVSVTSVGRITFELLFKYLWAVCYASTDVKIINQIDYACWILNNLYATLHTCINIGCMANLTHELCVGLMMHQGVGKVRRRGVEEG